MTSLPELPNLNDSIVPLFDAAAAQLASSLNIYYTPLLVVLGALGNLVSVFVFFRSKLRLQSTSQYLSALAISDTIFLCQLLPPWLTAVQLTNVFHHAGFCQVFVYISYVTCGLSAWLVVAFTVERFVAVLHPLRRHALCSVKRARHVIVILVVVALLLNAPVIRFAASSGDDCNIDFEYLGHAATFNLIDTAISFTVPVSVIIILNVSIMIGVCRLGRTRRQLVRQRSARAAPSRPAALARQALERLAERPSQLVSEPAVQAQNRVTRMLLVVSSVFVILNLPAYTIRILAYMYNNDSSQPVSARWTALQQLAILGFNTNFGINFLLYCLSGQNFRRALKQCLPWLRCGESSDTAMNLIDFRPARGSSVSTSCVSSTDVGGNAATASVSRRRRSEPVLQRWTFDNSRQLRTARLSSPSELQGRSAETPENWRPQRPEPEVRRIPMNLFPYRNLLLPRNANRDISRAIHYR